MQDNTAASRELGLPRAHTPNAIAPIIRFSDNGIWRCERCGYAEVHNPDYVITNSNFRKKAWNQKVTARSQPGKDLLGAQRDNARFTATIKTSAELSRTFEKGKQTSSFTNPFRGRATQSARQ